MTDVSRSATSVPTSVAGSPLPSLEGLTPEQAQAVRELAGGRDRLLQRLQRLHNVGSALSRSLEEGEILRELARQAARVIDADGIVIARPELDTQRIVTLVRMVGSLVSMRSPVPLRNGPI